MPSEHVHSALSREKWMPLPSSTNSNSRKGKSVDENSCFAALERAVAKRAWSKAGALVLCSASTRVNSEPPGDALRYQKRLVFSIQCGFTYARYEMCRRLPG